MPYSKPSDAPQWVQDLGENAAKQWVSVWNSIYNKTKDEKRAFAGANSIIKKQSMKASEMLAYDPEEPREPAGASGGGQWTSGGGGSSGGGSGKGGGDFSKRRAQISHTARTGLEEGHAHIKGIAETTDQNAPYTHPLEPGLKPRTRDDLLKPSIIKRAMSKVTPSLEAISQMEHTSKDGAKALELIKEAESMGKEGHPFTFDRTVEWFRHAENLWRVHGRKFKGKILSEVFAHQSLEEEVEVFMAGEIDLFRESFPDTFDGKPIRVQVFATGTWKHPKYGTMEVKLDDLKTMVKNFEETKRALVVDYDHGTDLGTNPEQSKAAGWLKELQIEEKGDIAALYGVFEATDQAADYIKKGEYRFFSPTFNTNVADKETGKSRGMTLLRGALTNSPFIDGMFPAVALNERAAKMLAEYGTGGTMTIRCKDGTNLAELAAQLEADGHTVTGWYKDTLMAEEKKLDPPKEPDPAKAFKFSVAKGTEGVTLIAEEVPANG